MITTSSFIIALTRVRCVLELKDVEWDAFIISYLYINVQQIVNVACQPNISEYAYDMLGLKWWFI